MKGWCSPALRLHFVSCSMYWKWWKAEQGPGNKGYCFVYHMILRKSLIDIAACVRVCVYVHVCVCVHVWEGVTSLIALYVKLNEAVALVRITWGSTCIISSVSYVCLPQQYIAHLQTAPDGANHKSIPWGWCQHGLSSKTRTDSQGEILCKSQLQSSLSLPKK